MSARFLGAKILGSLATLLFVVVFNFFLFRIVEGDPVANLFRGHNLTQKQRDTLSKQFGLDGSTGSQFVHYVEQTAKLNLGRSYVSNDPVASEIRRKAGPTIALVGISTVLSAVLGVLIGIAAAWKRGSKTDYAGTTFTMATYAMPDFWLGMLLLTAFAVAIPIFPVGGITDPTGPTSGVGSHPRPGQAHGAARAHAHARLPGRVRADHALLAAGDHARGLPGARARQGPARRGRAQPPRGAQRAAARHHAHRHQLRVRALRGDRGGGDLLLAGPGPGHLRRAEGPGPARCSRASSSSSARR